MVATQVRPGPYFTDDEEPSFRRYNSRGQGYPLSHDRELPSGSYGGPRDLLSNHDSRGGKHAPEPDHNSRPRSRIPVACGRCRKRKIRCSGDLGNGMPCTNCKGAGHESCAFLRVSSHETSMKNENIDNFSHYEHASAGPRIQCRMTPYGPHSSYISPGGSVPEGYYSRGNSMSSYVVPQSRYYALGSFSEYPEENVNVDYGVQASTYPMLASDQLIPPNYPPPNRGWTPAPQMTKTTPMYLEQDPTYNNTQVPYHNAYQLRPTISPEPKSLVHPVSMPIGINNNSLPPLSAGGTDRVLPFPATRTALPTQVGSYMRSNTVPHPGYHYDSIMSSNGLGSSKPVSNNGLPSATTLPPDAYMPYSSSSPESLASSAQTAYSTQQLSQQQADLYASGSDALYNSSDAAESSYGPSCEKRGSHSSQEALSQDGSVPSISSGGGLLSNGHAYTPFNSGTNYPAPPMDMPAPTPTRGVNAITSGISSS